jgi:malonyl-CoA O-methyltransferase
MRHRSDTLHVEIRGTGSDLVLLHGWALHGGMWGPWLEQLAAHARLHIIDLPGHGRSPPLAGAMDLAGLARAVTTSVPAGAGILGWSLGGMVALELARQRPADIAALVLIATTPSFVARPDWPQGMQTRVLEEFAASLARDYRRTIANFLALQTWGDERASAALRTLRANLSTHGEPDRATLEAGLVMLRESDLRGHLPQVMSPTLVIAGEHDRVTPAAAGRQLAAALPKARFVEVAKAGHAPFLSHPEAVLAEVVPFLRPLNRVPAARQPVSPMTEQAALTLDIGRVAASFDHAARDYDAAAVLQRKVRDELLARLDVVRLQPSVVLDLGAGTGHGAIALKRRYAKTRVLALDLAMGMLREAGRRQTLLRRFDRVAADAQVLPIGTGSVDMIFSNLMLQWCNDLDAALRECRRVLRPGGVLTFSTLGPDTLVELRRAWHAADPRHAHVNRFFDMHDVGDALARAGFAEPVLDVERYTLTYATARDLMRDLKTIGAHNANAGRPAGLTGKATLARMTGAYERFRREGKLPATYEVIFGQAWCPTGPVRTKIPQPGSEVLVPISQLRRRSNLPEA